MPIHPFLTIIGLITLLAGTPAVSQTVFVDAAATGDNNGTDWTNAYVSLFEALESSAPGAELWVAEGIYIPGSNRTDSFVLKPQMKLYGGFTSGMTDRSQRDWQAHQTILSGEIQHAGRPSTGAMRQDNSHYVVVGAANARLDGFVIRDGGDPTFNPANDPADQANVGGMLIKDIGTAAQTVANCHFFSNEAYYDTGTPPAGTGYGGAILVLNSSVTVHSSSFDRNWAHSRGGAIAVINRSGEAGLKVEIRDSIFRRNWMRMGEGESGGGSLWIGADDVLIDGCRFFDGRAGINAFVNGSGAAVCLPGGYSGVARIVNSVFASNATTLGRGGALFVGRDAIIEKSIFSGNSVERGSGGGLYVAEGARVQATDSIFAGNYAANAPRLNDLASGSGGAIAAGGTVIASNTILVGNAALGVTPQRGGGGAFNQLAGAGGSTLSRCVISDNEAVFGGGIFVADDLEEPVEITECTVRGNKLIAKSDHHRQIDATAAQVFRSNIDGGWTDGSNRDEDPGVIEAATGRWSEVSYDPQTGLTTLTDDQANWKPGALAGMCVLPNTTHRERVIETRGTRTTNITTMRTLQFVIHGNTENAITVWGNARSIGFWEQTPDVAGVGRGYRVFDYRPAVK